MTGFNIFCLGQERVIGVELVLGIDHSKAILYI
jgi:hypothetical protein